MGFNGDQGVVSPRFRDRAEVVDLVQAAVSPSRGSIRDRGEVVNLVQRASRAQRHQDRERHLERRESFTTLSGRTNSNSSYVESVEGTARMSACPPYAHAR
jgi:hypothetical protein